MNKIKNLSEYLNQTSKYDRDTFYRGECKDFGYTTCIATANRNYDNYNKYSERLNLFDTKIREGALVSNSDIIIPFAQHSGLATKLLDITSSPLVALYFACQGEEEDGYIYILDDYADVTELLTKYPKFDLEEVLLKQVDFIKKQTYTNLDDKEKIQRIENEELEEFGKAIKQYSDDSFEKIASKINPFEPVPLEESLFYTKKKGLDEQIEGIKNALLDIFSKIPEMKNSIFIESFDDQTPAIDVLHPLKKQRHDYSNLQYDEFTPEIKEYLMSLECLVAFIYDKSPVSNLSPMTQFNDLIMNFIPNLLYQPIMTFKRGLSQQSSFFVQPIFYKHGLNIHDYGSDKVDKIQSQLFKSRANYTTKLVIDGQYKKNILRELDKIGVNKATMFGDADNIADYIMNLNDEK